MAAFIQMQCAGCKLIKKILVNSVEKLERPCDRCESKLYPIKPIASFVPPHPDHVTNVHDKLELDQVERDRHNVKRTDGRTSETSGGTAEDSAPDVVSSTETSNGNEKTTVEESNNEHDDDDSVQQPTAQAPDTGLSPIDPAGLGRVDGTR